MRRCYATPAPRYVDAFILLYARYAMPCQYFAMPLLLRDATIWIFSPDVCHAAIDTLFAIHDTPLRFFFFSDIIIDDTLISADTLLPFSPC